MGTIRGIGIVILLGLQSGLISACATQSFELKSTPSAADIFTFGGEKLGTTPLVFSSEQINKSLIAPGKVGVRLSADGYLDRDVISDVYGESDLEVRLSAADDEYYNRKWIKDFPKQTNAMVREILLIQGYLITRNIPEAEKAIETFEKRFSNLAAIYVMRGSLELLKGNKSQARGYFLRARSLDAEDPVIARSLRQTEGAE